SHSIPSCPHMVWKTLIFRGFRRLVPVGCCSVRLVATRKNYTRVGKAVQIGGVLRSGERDHIKQNHVHYRKFKALKPENMRFFLGFPVTAGIVNSIPPHPEPEKRRI